MRKGDIKNIMITHNDTDYFRVWEWIGEVTLLTLVLGTNACEEEVLEDSEDIENFIISLIPTAIEFIQRRKSKYANICRYENVSEEDVKSDFEYLKSHIRFKYNFDKETDESWLAGGSDNLVIDLENVKSYTR